MKTIQEQIEVMQHFVNGGEVEYTVINGNSIWYPISNKDFTSWTWVGHDYRIKKPKVSITIEKWLIYDRINNYYSVEEASKIFLSSHISKVKLLETYKIEL